MNYFKQVKHFFYYKIKKFELPIFLFNKLRTFIVISKVKNKQEQEFMFNINTDLVLFFFMFRLINIVFTKSVNYNNLSDLFNLRQKYIMKKPEHYVHAFQIEQVIQSNLLVLLELTFLL